VTKIVQENIMVRDPVCKVLVDEKKTKCTSEYEGKKYYFCSEECRDEFNADPEEYVV